ncbi:unnamed protein product [Angiostrongylus costaricensis]|uniref:DUF1534 domain-containing protein n=1 Tax=Angiostrongylus costaricensis TaxID=334426 RepID=A0A0R3PSY3_ANGCS|nr:unnamed protein product [Angiostrongylus costaricensis]
MAGSLPAKVCARQRRVHASRVRLLVAARPPFAERGRTRPDARQGGQAGGRADGPAAGWTGRRRVWAMIARRSRPSVGRRSYV